MINLFVLFLFCFYFVLFLFCFVLLCYVILYYMFNPKLEFEKDVKKFNSQLNFTYKWKLRSENQELRIGQANDYKDKLGWYIELYDQSEYTEDYYANIYEPYKKLSLKLEKLLTIEEKMKSSLEKYYEPDGPNGNNFIFKKGNYIYKGTKYFYDPKEELNFYDTVPYGYYGDKYVGYYYAKRYNGGLQVYKLKKDLKLFNITNDKNMYWILNLVQNILKEGKQDEIFFNNISYREFYKAIKVKYGVGINKYFQAYNIAKYTKFTDMWLYEPEGNITSYRNNIDKSYTGWYYGAGFIDRVCATGIMMLIQDKFDGLTGKTGFYTPFSSLTGTEVIIWNQKDVLQRRPKHKYDAMQFVKKLDFDPFKINFDIKLGAKNKKFKIIKFYFNHQMVQSDNDKSNNPIQNDIKNIKGLRIMSLNIHNFKSINMNDTKEFILEQILILLNTFSIDICCFQEYYSSILPKTNEYSYIHSTDHLGLVIFYKNNLDLKNITSFRLPNEKNLDQDRFGLFFELNNKKFCVTHLEIGKRFYDRSGSLFYAEELIKIIKFNYLIRKKQLDKILNEDPDYIIGDFNFNNFDTEYEYLTKEHKYYTGLTDYTTPFGKQVDFIFSKSKYQYFTKINFQYSDHLPILAII